MAPRTEKKRKCPKCHQTVWRLSGDKFLKCHRCGWSVSRPVLRWITHPTWVLYYFHQVRHYPVSTLWNFAKTGAAIAIVVLFFTGILTVGGIQSSIQNVSPPDLTVNSSESAALTDQYGYNTTKIERRFQGNLNEERRSRGLPPVTQRDVLTEMGYNHSQNMAENDYFGHIEPDGDTIQDRYQQRDLLPECELPIQGTNRFYPGAENVGKLAVDGRLRVEWADGGTYYVSSEDDVAYALFQMWMHSEPHREAMLVSSADQAGLGIYIDSGEVYASLELC